MMCSLPSLAVFETLIWLLLAGTGLSRSLSSWYTGSGAPQLIMYDDETGKIFYSLCNSNSTPVFPADDTAAFHLDIPPANGTSVAGTGYQSEAGYIAAIHYISETGGIVQALFSCDVTGHYKSSPSQAWVVSADLQPAVNPRRDTDLMALLLGTTEGYRIYYTDEDGSLSVLQYTRGSTDDGRWSYGYHVNQRPTEGRPSIQAGFVNPDRITVISSNIDNADSAAVQVCTSREDDWLIKTFPSETYVMNMEGDDTHRGPFTGPMTNETEPDADLITPTTSSELVSYSSDETRLGIAFGAPAVRSVFYIGTDAALRQVQEVNGTWTPVGPATDQRRWPLADRPNPDFAVAHDSNRDNIWIYYYVGNDNDTDTDAGAGAGRQLTQVHQSASGVWEPAVALPASNDTAAAGEEPGPQAGDPGSDGGDDGGGLSGAGKVGVGVGVGLGLPLVAALVAAYVFVHARRSRRDRDAELAAAHAAAAGPGGAPPSFAGSPAPGYTSGYWGSSVSGEGGGGGGGGGGGYWANGQWVPADPQQQQHQSLLFSSKPENSQWQAQDPRLSQYSAVNSRGGSPPPAPAQPPVFHEMLHQEPAYEVAGDGQVPEMPVSQAAPTPRAVSPASVVGIQPRS